MTLIILQGEQLLAFNELEPTEVDSIFTSSCKYRSLDLQVGKPVGPKTGASLGFLSKLLKAAVIASGQIIQPESVHPPEAETYWSILKTAGLPCTRSFV